MMNKVFTVAVCSAFACVFVGQVYGSRSHLEIGGDGTATNCLTNLNSQRNFAVGPELDAEDEQLYAESRHLFTQDVLPGSRQLEELQAAYREGLCKFEQEKVRLLLLNQRPVRPCGSIDRAGRAFSSRLKEQRRGWKNLLEEQQYAQLDKELSAGLDSGVIATQFEAHEWIIQQVKCGLDPFLLYMLVRTTFNQPPRDCRTFFEFFEHLMLCISLTEIAHSVVIKLGLETSPGIGVADFAKTLKQKFVTKYNHQKNLLCCNIREKISFSEVRDCAVGHLIDLAVNEEALLALPLPHWVLRTKLSSVMGFETWRIDWALLTKQELGVRNNASLMGTIEANTQDAIEEQIVKLKSLNTWDEFLEIPAVL